VLFGYPRADIVGSNVGRFLSAPTLEEYRRIFADLDSASERFVFEGEILAQSGQMIPVSVSAASIILYGRHLVLGLHRDVTERKQAEAEIRRLQTAVEKLRGASRGSGKPEASER